MRERLLWSTILVVIALMVMGNVVSVMGAGLGCPDWPLCHGRVIPPLRWDAWLEFSHRLLGLGATVMILLSGWRIWRSPFPVARRLLLGVIGLLGVQILLGGVVVLLELPTLLTSLHLVLAYLILGLFFLSVWVVERRARRLKVVDRVALVTTALVLLQAFVGAVVRHSDAALVCPEFPTCLAGRWIPPVMNHALGVHLSHRWLAYFLALWPLPFLRRRWARVFLALVVLQIALGAWTVLSRIHLGVVSLHYLNAILMYVFLLHTAFRPVSEASGSPS